MVQLFIKSPATRVPERDYILEIVFENLLGVKTIRQYVQSTNDTVITLSGDLENRSLSISDVFLSGSAADWLKTESLPVSPLEVATVPECIARGPVTTEKIPVIFGEKVDGAYWVFGHQSRLAVDIFGSIFFMLTRYEEMVDGPRDHFGRFTSKASVAERNGFLNIPIVNVYVELLWNTLVCIWPGIRRRSAEYRCLLSHDVDVIGSVERSLLSMTKTVLFDLLGRRELGLAGRRISSFLRSKYYLNESVKEDPYNSFDFILDVSEKNGLISAFNFFAGNSGDRRDPVYEVRSDFVASLIADIADRGHEIGIHPGFGAFNSQKVFNAELTTLRDVCRQKGILSQPFGGRNHFLNWRNPYGWRQWEAAGLTYDSTLAYADAPGFRAGICGDYPVWDLLDRRRLRLVERPLIVMESSCLTYKKMSLEGTASVVCELADVCRRFSGQFTLLWHNHMLVSKRAKGIYADIIREVA
jgi:hypothetical protein